MRGGVCLRSRESTGTHSAIQNALPSKSQGKRAVLNPCVHKSTLSLGMRGFGCDFQLLILRKSNVTVNNMGCAKFAVLSQGTGGDKQRSRSVCPRKTDFVVEQEQGKSVKECIGQAEECAPLRYAFFECKRRQADARSRIQGNKADK